MLSILIPVRDYDVKALVTVLDQQCRELSIAYEIIIADDASERFVELPRTVDANIVFRRFDKQQGRAQIRNHLAQAARYNYLLFLDADQKVNSPNFIAQYVDYISAQKKAAICGGRSYADTIDESKAGVLHWHYGRHREMINAELRQKQAWQYLHTNNLLVPKELVLQIPFDSSLTQYGYEDLAWGYALAQADIPILHINNPIEHTGLKGQEQFISDQIAASKNLAQLWSQQNIGATRLIAVYTYLEKSNMIDTYLFLIKCIGLNRLEALLGNIKWLKILDIVKLYYFIISLRK